VRVAVAGAGAFGIKHLDALDAHRRRRDRGRGESSRDQAQEVAERYGVHLATDEFNDVLEDDSIDAVILCTPTQLHASQALATMDAGKHVQIEIPLADSGPTRSRSPRGRGDRPTCMVGHTRRFNPSHQWIHQRVVRDELSIQQMDVQTYFFRRTNTNALGQPRSWTDNLLWHHAAHTVDLFAYQTQSPITEAHCLAGPIQPDSRVYRWTCPFN
jgi:2-hydroxy-4-carboxymuconate semialdehyde hemiacetal dehydrogenase